MWRYGFAEEANQVLTALYEAALQFPYYRLPELFCGIARTAYGVPIGYPVACSPQAWAAGALPFMLSQSLGLYPTAGTSLRIARPVLPRWLGDVRVHGLRVGNARIDLTFAQPRAAGEPAKVKVQQKGGPVEVVVTDDLPPV
jgi:glycogen debranching enzyme